MSVSMLHDKHAMIVTTVLHFIDTSSIFITNVARAHLHQHTSTLMQTTGVVGIGLRAGLMQGFSNYYPFKGSQIIGAFKGFPGTYRQIPKQPRMASSSFKRTQFRKQTRARRIAARPQRVAGVYSSFECRY